MELKELGKTGEKIPVLGIGTWKMGVNRQSEIDAIKMAINDGMRFVDTAELYKTEDIVGEALKGEKDVFVATKLWPNHFAYEDAIKACDASLAKLKIKTIDLYQLHWPNPGVPIAETMRAMEKLVKDGKIRYIGVSNFSVKEFEQAQSALKNNEIVSNQVEYSILTRDIENELLEFSQKNKITIIAYSPLARGAIFESKYSQFHELLSKIGAKYNKSVTQVALNWLILKEPVVAIPKASTIAHVKEIEGASGWKLSKEDISEVDSFLYKKRASIASSMKPLITGAFSVQSKIKRAIKKNKDSSS